MINQGKVRKQKDRRKKEKIPKKIPKKQEEEKKEKKEEIIIGTKLYGRNKLNQKKKKIRKRGKNSR